MPRRLNPGPLAARIAFFAPVSLGFFFVWIFAISLMRKVDLHPMHYLFLGASFFAFHLLLAYTVDRIDLVPAFLLASVVSVFLVVSYLRLVAGMRFAAVEAGGSQLVYLVLFSYAHFFEGFTGLLVTVGSILTLFALMQLTARIRWDEVFSRGGVQSRPEASR
jgi:inner membrane protein involved in colicin E2 resistance